MSSINSKRPRQEAPRSELPVPVRWVEGEALETEGWHDDWDEGPASHISMLSEVSEVPEALDAGATEESTEESAEEDEKAWLEDGDESAAAPAPEEEAPISISSEEDAKVRGRRRSKTIARKQMLRERRRMLAQGTIPEIVDYERPTHRAECRDDKRPCLYVSCRYHLYLDVNPMTGSIKLNFPDKEVWELEETCALDVAERGGITLEEVGEIMNLTRERIRQVEVSGLEKLKGGEVKLHTFIDGRELELDTMPPAKRLPIVDD
jgi:hypothetical protein